MPEKDTKWLGLYYKITWQQLTDHQLYSEALYTSERLLQASDLLIASWVMMPQMLVSCELNHHLYITVILGTSIIENLQQTSLDKECTI